MKSNGQHNSHNSGQHRSLTLAFEQFRFRLRIRGDIRNLKSANIFWQNFFSSMYRVAAINPEF
jgi:hypothetical protein